MRRSRSVRRNVRRSKVRRSKVRKRSVRRRRNTRRRLNNRYNRSKNNRSKNNRSKNNRSKNTRQRKIRNTRRRRRGGGPESFGQVVADTAGTQGVVSPQHQGATENMFRLRAAGDGSHIQRTKMGPGAKFLFEERKKREDKRAVHSLSRDVSLDPVLRAEPASFIPHVGQQYLTLKKITLYATMDGGVGDEFEMPAVITGHMDQGKILQLSDFKLDQEDSTPPRAGDAVRLLFRGLGWVHVTYEDLNDMFQLFNTPNTPNIPSNQGFTPVTIEAKLKNFPSDKRVTIQAKPEGLTLSEPKNSSPMPYKSIKFEVIARGFRLAGPAIGNKRKWVQFKASEVTSNKISQLIAFNKDYPTNYEADNTERNNFYFVPNVEDDV